MAKRKFYSEKFKNKAIELGRVEGFSEAGKKLGLNNAMIGRWSRERAAMESPVMEDAKPEIERTALAPVESVSVLKLQILILKAENDILRKALGMPELNQNIVYTNVT